MEEGRGVNHAGLVSQLLQLQPLLAGGHFDMWNGLPGLLPIRPLAAGELASGGRNVNGSRQSNDSKAAVIKMEEEKTGIDIAAVDLRHHHQAKVLTSHVDKSNGLYSNGIADPTAIAGNVPTLQLVKLLDDIWSRRKKNGIAAKRLAPVKRNATKDRAAMAEKRALITAEDERRAVHDSHRLQQNDSKQLPPTSIDNLSSSSSVHSLLYCGSSVENGRPFAEKQSNVIPSNRSPISVQVSCSQSYREAISSDQMRSNLVAPFTKTSSPVMRDYSHRGNGTSTVQPDIDSRSRDENPGLRKTLEETEYTARFGKYCRLARELAGKSD